MTYGSSIGRKFYEDGRVRRYPGNTVIARITPECTAYDVMCHLRQMVIDAGLDDHFILMPTDSYHTTITGCLNDQVRKYPQWPKDLPLDAPMTQVDDYVTEALSKIPIPGPECMRFDAVNIGNNAFTVRLLTADEEQERISREYRTKVAAALDKEDNPNYRFHITLAYTRIIPEGEAEERAKKLAEAMNEYISKQPAFITGQPYVAYYDDMFYFSPTRVPRDK